MNYVKMFESFFNEYSNKLQKIESDFRNDLLIYLQEITDDFPDFTLETSVESFLFRIKIKYSDCDKFLEIYHEGIFHRIIDSHPGTEIIYGIDVVYGNSGTSIPLANSWRNTHNSIDFYEIPNLIDRYMRRDATGLLDPDYFLIKIWIS